MESLTTIIHFEVWLILGGLALIVGYQMLTGKINTTGLLHDKKDKQTAGFSPARV